MRTPQNERDVIDERIKSVAEGQLPVDAAVFRVVKCIVGYDDAALLDEVPENIAEWIRALIAMYKEEGKAILYFNTGEADHTELVRQLIEVLERPTVPQDGQT